MHWRMVLQYQHKPTNMHIHYTYFISVVRMHKLLIEVCESLFISVQSSPFSKRLNKYHLYSWLSINKNRTTSNLNALGIINKLWFGASYHCFQFKVEWSYFVLMVVGVQCILMRRVVNVWMAILMSVLIAFLRRCWNEAPEHINWTPSKFNDFIVWVPKCLTNSIWAWWKIEFLCPPWIFHPPKK